MSAPAITLEVLPAGFGDCLLLTCHDRGRDWRMLVDTGPDETYPQLRTRLLIVFSTNNAYFGHPNDEAEARALKTADAPVLWFNYDTTRNRRWLSPTLMARCGYEVRLPQRPDGGVSIEVPGR